MYTRALPPTLFQGLSTSVFVACSINTGEGMVKLIMCSNIQYLDIGCTCGGLAHSFCTAITQLLSKAEKHHQDYLMSTTQWSVVANSSTLTYYFFPRMCRFSTRPSMIHPTSRYVTACEKVYQAFPCVSTASNNTGAKGWGTRVVQRHHSEK